MSSPLVAAWSALGQGRWVFKLIALPAVTALVAVTFITTERQRGTDALGMTAIVVSQTLFMALVLIALRRRGFRLTRIAHRPLRTT